MISNCLHSPVRREKLAIALENEGYIKKLISLFNMCEDLENMEGLHLLYEIFKNIFLLNKNALFEIMFADDMIFDVVGALEYDPSSPYPKKHRQFLKSRVKFKEVSCFCFVFFMQKKNKNKNYVFLKYCVYVLIINHPNLTNLYNVFCFVSRLFLLKIMNY